MSGQGFKDRKKFIRDVNQQIRGYRIERRDFPDLKPGEFVYYVKNRLTGDMKYVVATTREDAEKLAFPDLEQSYIRSMPVKGHKEPSKLKPKEEDDGQTE